MKKSIHLKRCLLRDIIRQQGIRLLLYYSIHYIELNDVDDDDNSYHCRYVSYKSDDALCGTQGIRSIFHSNRPIKGYYRLGRMRRTHSWSRNVKSIGRKLWGYVTLTAIRTPCDICVIYCGVTTVSLKLNTTTQRLVLAMVLYFIICWCLWACICGFYALTFHSTLCVKEMKGIFMK